jgi:hypothetical protein
MRAQLQRQRAAHLRVVGVLVRKRRRVVHHIVGRVTLQCVLGGCRGRQAALDCTVGRSCCCIRSLHRAIPGPAASAEDSVKDNLTHEIWIIVTFFIIVIKHFKLQRGPDVIAWRQQQRNIAVPHRRLSVVSHLRLTDELAVQVDYDVWI